MSFSQNLNQWRSLCIRTLLVLGVCVGGLVWMQSHGDPDFEVKVDDASPPVVQLSFTAAADCYYYAEYWDVKSKTWIPIPNSERFLHEGEHLIFIEVSDLPVAASRIPHNITGIRTENDRLWALQAFRDW